MENDKNTIFLAIDENTIFLAIVVSLVIYGLIIFVIILYTIRKERIKTALNKSKSESLLSSENNNTVHTFKNKTVKHFDYIIIKKYKIFENFKLEKLNRINIFAGFNNSGKTTLLEAIYLLIQQNNMGALFDIIKVKNKLNELTTLYLTNNIINNIEILGQFNGVKVTIDLEKFEAIDINKNDYLASYKINSSIDDDFLDNTIHIFNENSLERRYERIEILCNSIFKSPYFYNQDEIVETYSKSLKSGEIDEIITFIQKHIDSNIIGISHDGINTFIVKHKIPINSPELTSYGEGLQRIFEIALSFAYCKNGVLLIDEFETAIHYSLLVDFTKFIQELAIKFNVQVFITSHSKECIDAFVNNGVHNEDISAYLLDNISNNIEAIYIDGEELKEYIDSTDFDLRGQYD